MENFIFERDYRGEPKQEFLPYHNAHFCSLMDKLVAVLDTVPKKVKETKKVKHDYLLERLDEYAKKYSGKLEGRVDFTKYSAEIKLTMDQFDFWGSDLSYLVAVSFCSDIAEFTMNEDGTMQLGINVFYFESEMRNEELASIAIKDPDCWALLKEQAAEGKENPKEKEVYKKRRFVDSKLLKIIKSSIEEF